MIITLLIILLIVTFSLINHLRKEKLLRAKMQIEDALKHIYMSNKENIPATLNSIKGHQKISDKSALAIIANLLNNKLAFRKKNNLFLTEEGKKYAINVIKNHRLWERYLAEESGVKVEDWHNQAEKMEHKLTEKERIELRKKLGNPLRDPHGDAIPGETETDFESAGEQLSEITEIGNYKIVHIEDEPYEIYTEIIKHNLFPEMIIEVMGITNDEILLRSEHGEINLSKSVACNINVLKSDEELIENIKSLSDLEIGESGVVVKLSRKLRGTNRRRLLDLGIIPGTKIKVMYQNISGNPRAYEVKNTLIALRNDVASAIYVKEIDND